MIKHLLSIPEPPENLLGIPPEERAELDALYADVIEAAAEMRRLLDETAEALKTAIGTLAETVEVVINNIGPICSQITGAIAQVIDQYPNKRVIHLAKHGKQRTRKKNINRITKYFEREAKKRPAFAQN